MRKGQGLGAGLSRGLTMVEAVVAAAVILLALLVLMPRVVYHHVPARAGRCQSNLGQVFLAFMLYANAHDTWIVCGGNRADEHDEPPVVPPGNTDPRFPFWHEALPPYGCSPGNYACPSKRDAAIGYGYNYAAPYGVDAIYSEKPELAKGRDKPGPVPVLWYGQSVTLSVIKEPSEQIAFCEAGLVTNDSDLKTRPDRWQESDAANITGYVRFPLCDSYTRSAKYRTAKAWRPAARHDGSGERAVCVFFDGHAERRDLNDIVGHEWGDRGCLFDNAPGP